MSHLSSAKRTILAVFRRCVRISGIIQNDERLASLALEYLERVLPPDIREKLWPFIGDVSERQRQQALRPLPEVISALVNTGATLFATESERAALKRILDGK